MTPFLQAMLAVITTACRQMNREYAHYGLHTDPTWLAMVDGAQLRQVRHRLHGAAAASLEDALATLHAIDLLALLAALFRDQGWCRQVGAGPVIQKCL